MRILAKRTLRDYWESHPTAEEPLRSWYRIVKGADWDSPASVKASLPKASIVGDNRAVFNIRGNDYRLIVQFNYPRRIVYVRFIGTHAEYDRIDARKV